MPEFVISSTESLVHLRIARGQTENAALRMKLAAPLSRTKGDPGSLWLGPDQWWITSRELLPGQLIGLCRESLSGLTFNATDNSDAITKVQVTGSGVRELLASGCGLDFAPISFPIGGCQRTRFAQVLVTIVATDRNEYELLFDSAYTDYLCGWLEAAAKTLRNFGDR